MGRNVGPGWWPMGWTMRAVLNLGLHIILAVDVRGCSWLMLRGSRAVAQKHLTNALGLSVNVTMSDCLPRTFMLPVILAHTARRRLFWTCDSLLQNSVSTTFSRVTKGNALSQLPVDAPSERAPGARENAPKIHPNRKLRVLEHPPSVHPGHLLAALFRAPCPQV